MNVKLWRLQDRGLLATYSGFTDQCIHSCTFAREKELIAAASRSELKIWDYRSDSLLVDTIIPYDIYRDLLFFREDQALMGIGNDTLFIYSLRSKQFVDIPDFDARLYNAQIHGPYLSVTTSEQGADEQDYYKVMDLRTNEVIFSEKITIWNYPKSIWMKRNEELVNIVLDGDGQRIILFWPEKREKRIVKTGIPKQEFSHSPKSQLLPIEDNAFLVSSYGTIKIFDLQSLTIAQTFPAGQYYYHDVLMDTFSQSLILEKRLYTKEFFNPNFYTLLYDYRNKRFTDTLSISVAHELWFGDRTFHPMNEQYWLLLRNDSLLLYEKENRQIEELPMRSTAELDNVYFVGNDQLCACFENQPPLLINLQTFAVRPFQYASDKYSPLAPPLDLFDELSACGKVKVWRNSIFVEQGHELYRFDRNTLQVQERINPEESYLHDFEIAADYLHYFDQKKKSLQLYDLKKQQFVAEVKLKKEIDNYAINADNTLAAVVYYKGGKLSNGEKIDVLEFPSGKKLSSLELADPKWDVYGTAVGPDPFDPERLMIGGMYMHREQYTNDTRLFRLQRERRRKFFPDTFYTHVGYLSSTCLPLNGDSCFMSSRDRPAIFLDRNGNLAGTYKDPFFDDATSASINPSQDLIAYKTMENEIRIVNLKNRSEVYSIQLFDDDFFFFSNPEGYYTYIGDANEQIKLRRGLDLYALHQFDLHYNRPDLLIAGLPQPDTAAQQQFTRLINTRQRRFGSVPNGLDNPKAAPEILQIDFDQSVDTVVFAAQQRKIQIQVTCRARPQSLARLHLWLNDIPLHGRQGLQLPPNKDALITIPLDIALSEGLNRIELSASDYEGRQSAMKTFSLNFRPDQSMSPSLYFIGIGVARYDHLPDLVNVDRDVSSFKALLEENKNGLYRQVITHTFLNEEFRWESLTEIGRILENTREEDRVILFYSGHGGFDRDNEYMVFTQHTSLKQDTTSGIPYSELEALLDGIPARKKLLLLNACNSGEYDQDMEAFRLMNDLFVNLSRGSGTMIISSSASDQASYTGLPIFGKNSALGRALIDYFQQEETISIVPLSQHLEATVRTLSRGKQIPELRNNYRIRDFRIW